MPFSHPILEIVTKEEFAELVRKIQYCEISSIVTADIIRQEPQDAIAIPDADGTIR